MLKHVEYILWLFAGYGINAAYTDIKNTIRLYRDSRIRKQMLAEQTQRLNEVIFNSKGK